jgi:hypothetical protein
MRITFELQEDVEERLAHEAQRDRRSKNNQAYILFLKGLDAAEAERVARQQATADVA